MDDLPPLIIMRGNDICYLGIVRSCFEASIPCISVQFTWPNAPIWYSESSRYQPEVIKINNPYTDADVAAKQLQEALKSLHNYWQQKLLILPSSDTNYMFILDYYEYFSDYILLMGDKNFEKPRLDIMHKGKCAELLMKNAPELVPKTYRCASIDVVDMISNNISYPAVYKPAVKDYGQTFYSSHDGNKAIECQTSKELKTRLNEELRNGFDLVVQEKILFDSVYDEIPFYLYADESGEITMAANGVKEIIEPFPYGTAIALRFAWYPEMMNLAKKVVAALSYRGILMIEFVRDKKDGNWKVIEVNPRHWLFNGFYHRLGLNFTKALFDDIHFKKSESDSVLASQEIIKKNNLHMDLFQIVRHFETRQSKKYTSKDFINNLGHFEGNLSSTYLAPTDMGPGIKSISMMALEYSWEEKLLFQAIENSMSGL